MRWGDLVWLHPPGCGRLAVAFSTEQKNPTPLPQAHALYRYATHAAAGGAGRLTTGHPARGSRVGWNLVPGSGSHGATSGTAGTNGANAPEAWGV